MYKKINLLLFVIVAMFITGCSSGFNIVKFTNHERTRDYNKSYIPIIYEESRINKIKMNNEDYMEIAIISGRNWYGNPQLDDVFKERLREVCNELGGDIMLYELDKSIPQKYHQVYTIVKKCYPPEYTCTRE